jgi:hypothetical protein
MSDLTRRVMARGPAPGGLLVLLLLLVGGLILPAPVLAQTVYTPVTPSQMVDCNLVDRALGRIPHGDGDGVVTHAETGPGGWRFSRLGQSFVTFAYEWNAATQEYDVVAGRSAVGANAGIVNDYPAVLDLPQAPSPDQLVFRDRSGEIVLTGDDSTDPPAFKLPGRGPGRVRIPMTETDVPGTYEGCAVSPLLRNFGVVVAEGGDFVQKEYFKAYAETDADGNVTFFETTEVSTFKNVRPGEN